MPSHTADERRPGAALWIVSVLTLLALCIAFVVPLFDDEVVHVPELGLTPADVVRGADDLDGEDVVVSGAVGRVLGPRAFVIGASADAGSGLLVILKEDLVDDDEGAGRVVVRQGDIVQVTGEVGRFGSEELRNEVDADELHGDLAGLRGRAAVAGEQIAVQPRR